MLSGAGRTLIPAVKRFSRVGKGDVGTCAVSVWLMFVGGSSDRGDQQQDGTDEDAAHGSDTPPITNLLGHLQVLRESARE